MIKKILLASDFTTTVTNAENYTLDFARVNKAQITVLHAIEPVANAEGDAGVSRFLEHQRATALKQAENVATRFRDEGLECNVEVLIGERWRSIVDHARAGDYDLVVLGSHNIHDSDKVYMGTTTQKVFFAADLPLLIVPAT